MFKALLQTDQQSTEDTGRMTIEETLTGVIAHAIEAMLSLLQDGTTDPIGALVILIPTQT